MKQTADHLLNIALVRAAQNADASAFESLVKRWQPKLLAYAQSQLRDRELALEAVQETLLYLSQSLHKLLDPEAFPKWVYQILHRRCVDQVRAAQRHRTSILDGDPECQEAERVHLHNDLLRAIQKLSRNSVQVIRLFYLEGFSANEMSEILDLPTGTIKSRLFYARRQLESLLEENHE